MFRTRIICLLLTLVCLVGVCTAATAVELESDSTYCFKSADFGAQEETLTGICITALPKAEAGTVLLGSRVIRSGDILTAEQLEQLRFVALQTESDQDAVLTYLPIYETRVAPSASMTIAIHGKQDQPPVAEDSMLETYKNLPGEGQLKVTDPEGQPMTYTVTRQPRRGDVSVREDGSFVYTPKKNKVGTDSFTFTATDPAGHVSREATVTIRILKPVDATQYTDTVGKNCRFAAEWMKNTGLFVGEQINGAQCFHPERTVSRGEFVAMLVKSLELPVDEDASYTGFTDNAPTWLKPYLAAAMRAGLTAGWPHGEVFGADEPVTGGEAALLLQNALDLPVSGNSDGDAAPAWAADALLAMSNQQIVLPADAALTRGEVALVLYRVSQVKETAPGMSVFRRQ